MRAFLLNFFLAWAIGNNSPSQVVFCSINRFSKIKYITVKKTTVNYSLLEKVHIFTLYRQTSE